MTHENTLMTPKKKVFISYARKDSTSAEVDALVKWLNGHEEIDVISDHRHADRAPEQGWYAWMQQSIEDADVVLCICGKVFKKGFEKRGGTMGVAFEGGLVTAELYEKRGWNKKFHPILPKAGAYKHVPKSLKPWENGVVLTQRDRILRLIKEEIPPLPLKPERKKGNPRKLIAFISVFCGVTATMAYLNPWKDTLPDLSTSGLSTQKDRSPGMREQVARALFSKGTLLKNQGKSEEAIAIYNEIALRFGEDPSPGVREWVAKALQNKGFTLESQGKREEAIAVYHDVALRFGEDPSSGVREPVAMALNNQGIALESQGKSEEAIAVFNDVALRFGEDPSPVVRELVAEALFNKGVAFVSQGKNEESIAAFQDVDLRFGEDPLPGVRKRVAQALFNKSEIFGRQGKREEAVAILSQIYLRFGEDPSPGVREVVAEALFVKGTLLLEQGKREEAKAIYDQIDRRFGEDPSSGVR